MHKLPQRFINQIFGIFRLVCIEEIKTAYRKLSLKLHPDQNNGDKFFEERFKDINEAYEELIKNAYITCPRCLGKGHVSLEDIDRLNRGAFWSPGGCKYCGGSGKVEKGMPQKVDPRERFLGQTLSEEQKRNIKFWDKISAKKKYIADDAPDDVDF